MRTWWAIATDTVAHVADRPRLWIPGGLAWLVTVGWLAFVIGVARPPTVGELTVLGAGIVTSGAWPWNLVGILAAALLAATGAAALAAAAEAELQRRDRFDTDDLARALGLALVCGLPLLLAGAIIAGSFATIAVLEFNSPVDGGGPLLRIASRLLPLIGLALLLAWAAGALHAAASRSLAAGASVLEAIRRAPPMLRAAGGAALTHAVASLVLRVAYVVVTAMLLRVLWVPIETRLVLDGIGLASGLLLVGFVAIWLCLILGGGALHAWGSVTWSRLLAAAAEVQEEHAPAVESPAQP